MTDVIFFLSFFGPVFLIYGDKINCSIKWDDESVELAIREIEREKWIERVRERESEREGEGESKRERARSLFLRQMQFPSFKWSEK